MKNPVTDHIVFVKEARAALEEAERARQEQQQIAVECKRCEKIIAAEEKAVVDKIGVMVRERQDSIVVSYDRELSAAQEKLRKLRGAKARARNVSMHERIKEETSVLTEENKSLGMKIKTLYHQSGAPHISRNRLFHMIFMPKGILEWAAVFLVSALVYLFIPYVGFRFLPKERDFVLAAAVYGYAIVTGGIYVYISNRIKHRFMECHLQARAMRQLIRSNKKKIKVITTAIRKDSDESAYHLEGYNYDIAKLEAELEDVASRKQEALNIFDAVTRQVIADEITEGSKERIMQLKADLVKHKERLKEADASLQKINIHITDTYEGYLGKDFLTRERLDALLIIFEQGQASTLTDAISIYRNKS